MFYTLARAINKLSAHSLQYLELIGHFSTFPPLNTVNEEINVNLSTLCTVNEDINVNLCTLYTVNEDINVNLCTLICPPADWQIVERNLYSKLVSRSDVQMSMSL